MRKKKVKVKKPKPSRRKYKDHINRIRRKFINPDYEPWD